MKAIANKNSQTGFTLIEVLVALLIVGIGMVAVIDLTSNHIRNITELEKRIIAGWVASNHLAEIRFDAQTERIREGSDSERTKMGGRRWRSRARIIETDVEKVFLVTVTVSDESERDASIYASLTTAITDPL